jgi:hypothetical protein
VLSERPSEGHYPARSSTALCNVLSVIPRNPLNGAEGCKGVHVTDAGKLRAPIGAVPAPAGWECAFLVNEMRALAGVGTPHEAAIVMLVVRASTLAWVTARMWGKNETLVQCLRGHGVQVGIAREQAPFWLRARNVPAVWERRIVDAFDDLKKNHP